MKKIISKNLVDPKKLITKSAYAEKEGITRAAVTKRIKCGNVSIILIEGGEIIHL